MSERDGTEIERGDMGKFPREVQDLVLHLVNNEGIRYRGIDKNHMALYPPDGVSRPFKIAASRPAESQVMFIERQFMAVYGVKGADGTVPYTKEDEVAVTRTELGVAETEGAAEAVRTLAAALGISLDGTVTEEDYLAVVAEKDQCRAEADALSSDLGLARDEIAVRDQTIADLTAQRDQLLVEKSHLLGAMYEAQDALAKVTP